jgi:hypothetical protein
MKAEAIPRRSGRPPIPVGEKLGDMKRAQVDERSLLLKE